MPQTFIISLGGSIFFPNEINIEFIKSFYNLIKDRVEKGDKFIIITGGGRLARLYQGALLEIKKNSTDIERDWVGIFATQSNCKFIKAIFGDLACDDFIFNPTQKIEFNKPIMFGAGYEPGCSTDMDAVLVAQTYGIKTIVNISNIEKIYTKDPNKFEDAEPLDNISWDELAKIVGEKWTPGMNSPFDPIASKLAKELNLKVVALGGKNIQNLYNFFNGNEFEGSVIEG